MITACTSSTDVDLTTTGALRAEILGATATSTVQDARFSDLIRRASRWIENELDRGPLGIQIYEETLPAFGAPTLLLSRRPVRVVLGLFSSTATSDDTEILSSEYRVENAEAGILRRPGRVFPWTAMDGGLLDAAPMPNADERPYLVRYIAGWTYAGLSTDSPAWSTAGGTTDTGRSLPEDLEQAAILKAKGWYRQTAGIKSKTVDDLSITYTDRGYETEIDDLLSQYRSLA